jgi:hypothetical protein
MTECHAFKIIVDSEKAGNIEFRCNPVYGHDVVSVGNDMKKFDATLPEHPAKAIFEPGPKNPIEYPETGMEACTIDPSEARTHWQVNLFGRPGRWRGPKPGVYAQHRRMIPLKKGAQ